MKKIMTGLLSAALAFGLIACGGEATTTAGSTAAETAAAESQAAETTAAEATAAALEQSGAGKKVGILIYKFDDNFMTTYREALEKMLTEKGYEVTVQDGNNDQAKQNEQINTYVTQGVDALIINPVMTSAAATIINTVQMAGIPTVLINREPTAEDMGVYDKLAYVGCDAAQSGTYQGELILETPNKGDINGDGTVSYLMIQGDPENIDAQLRTEFSVKALTDAGVKVEQLDMQRGDWDQIKGQEIAATALTQHGDKLEVIFANNDAMALGALQAIQAAGRTVGEDIYLVGVDALPDALDKVKEGSMTGTVLNDALAQADLAIKTMEELLSGKTFAPGAQVLYVNYVKVTKDNVTDFIAQ